MPIRASMFMYFVAYMYYTWHYFVIFTLAWYIDERNLHILGLMTGIYIDVYE
jgi:hypothetical protein